MKINVKVHLENACVGCVLINSVYLLTQTLGRQRTRLTPLGGGGGVVHTPGEFADLLLLLQQLSQRVLTALKLKLNYYFVFESEIPKIPDRPMPQKVGNIFLFNFVAHFTPSRSRTYI